MADLPRNYATPSTYEVGGHQYVVVAAGGGDKAGAKTGDRYYCFALPKPSSFSQGEL